MSPAERLADRAMTLADKAVNSETVRVCNYIAEQALYGNRDEADIAYLGHTLTIHTRSIA